MFVVVVDLLYGRCSFKCLALEPEHGPEIAKHEMMADEGPGPGPGRCELNTSTHLDDMLYWVIVI